MDEKAWAIIKAIITKRKRRRSPKKKGDGYIVLEDKREIKFRQRKTAPVRAEERH